MQKKLIPILAFATLFAGVGFANASTIPSGVLNDVSYSTVVNEWGWKEISRSNYGTTMSISDLFAGHGTHVMIAAMRSGSNIIDVLAADNFSTVTTYTAENITNVSNNVGWYFNGYSMGFAGATDTIFQYTADLAGRNERDRLSWHTTMIPNNWAQDATIAPLYVFNGWRSGDNTEIYTNTDWERVVFTLDVESTDVPEPASIALLGLGLAGLMIRRRLTGTR